MGTESLLTLVAGGIVFDTPSKMLAGPPSPPGSTFRLYADRQAAEEAAEGVRVSYRLSFPGSLRGVGVGTPVELRGIIVGRVYQLTLEYDPTADTLRVPVIIEIDPDRIAMPAEEARQNPIEATNQMFEHLVSVGLRARIGSGNLLLGQRLIELDFVPHRPRGSFKQSLILSCRQSQGAASRRSRVLPADFSTRSLPCRSIVWSAISATWSPMPMA